MLATSEGSSVVACEHYYETALFFPWRKHFIAKHGSLFAFAGSEDTAIRRAKLQQRDSKGKSVWINEYCRIRAINEHEGRRFAMGIRLYIPEHIFAFDNAALRDAWVAMLQV